MWHVSSRSGVATLRTAIHLLLLLTLRKRSDAPAETFHFRTQTAADVTSSRHPSCWTGAVSADAAGSDECSSLASPETIRRRPTIKVVSRDRQPTDHDSLHDCMRPSRRRARGYRAHRRRNARIRQFALLFIYDVMIAHDVPA